MGATTMKTTTCCLLALLCTSAAFTSPRPNAFRQSTRRWAEEQTSIPETADVEISDDTSPTLRTGLAAVASLGSLETLYLTLHDKGEELLMCDAIGASCSDVLNGPYSVVPGTDLPLSAFGCVAYAATAILLFAGKDDLNRALLMILTTALATFSAYLLTLLLTVLKESCLYCFASAAASWTLMGGVWFGIGLPKKESSRVAALQSSAATFIGTTLASYALFVNSAVAAETSLPPQAPPTVTQKSSKEAMVLGKDLKKLNARMYGAYWCGHCYEQKQALGKEAFYENVQYVECAKDGVNSQTDLCKENNVPGYPTWQINGELFPGEQDLEELKDIVKQVGK